VNVDNKSLVLFGEEERIHFLSLQFGYHSDNYLCNDGGSDHDCEVYPESWLICTGCNEDIGTIAPIEVILAFLNLIFCPLVILVQIFPVVEVVSIVASNREVISINGSVLNQLTNYIYRNVCKDDGQIHIKMLVRERDAVDDKVDNQYKQGEVGRQNNNHLAPLTETEIEVGCTNLISEE
jgi:hypothetical protein